MNEQRLDLLQKKEVKPNATQQQLVTTHAELKRCNIDLAQLRAEQMQTHSEIAGHHTTIESLKASNQQLTLCLEEYTEENMQLQKLAVRQAPIVVEEGQDRLIPCNVSESFLLRPCCLSSAHWQLRPSVGTWLAQLPFVTDLAVQIPEQIMREVSKPHADAPLLHSQPPCAVTTAIQACAANVNEEPCGDSSFRQSTPFEKGRQEEQASNHRRERSLERLFDTRRAHFYATRPSSSQMPYPGFVHYRETCNGALAVVRPQRRRQQQRISHDPPMPQLQILSIPASSTSRRNAAENVQNLAMADKAVFWCAVPVMRLNVALIGFHTPATRRFHLQHGFLSWFFPDNDTHIVELPKVRKGFALRVSRSNFLTGRELLDYGIKIQRWWRKKQRKKGSTLNLLF